MSAPEPQQCAIIGCCNLRWCEPHYVRKGHVPPSFTWGDAETFPEPYAWTIHAFCKQHCEALP